MNEIQSTGGQARAESLTDEQRKNIASKAAKARWGSTAKQASEKPMLAASKHDALQASEWQGKRTPPVPKFTREDAIAKRKKGQPLTMMDWIGLGVYGS